MGYVKNEARRFYVFVANRVQRIRDHTASEQWNYVESKCNPADDASRGLKSSEIASDSRWMNGPPFLYEARQDWQHYNQPDEKAFLLLDDVEVKKIRIPLRPPPKNIPTWYNDWNTFRAGIGQREQWQFIVIVVCYLREYARERK